MSDTRTPTVTSAARTGGHRLRAAVTAAAALLLTAAFFTVPGTARADVYAPGVSTSTVWDTTTPLYNSRGTRVDGLAGRTQGKQGVTEVEFGRLGDAFVAEKSGRIAYFSSTLARSGSLLTDASGADLTADTLAVGDDGLSGIAIDPGWPLRPYIYAFYLSNDKLPGQGTGKWTNAECSGPSYPCMADGRIERLTISARIAQGHLVRYIAARKTLVNSGWCQHAQTHGTGDLTFDRSGYLYASSGDGTFPNVTDTQTSVCGANGVDTAYAGRLATQDVLDPDVSPSLNGKIIRIDPTTGSGAPGNPEANSADANRRRIVAAGFRNPFRMNVKSGSDTLGVSVVGEGTNETVYQLTDPLAGVQRNNAGWPCWEGTQRFSNAALCSALSPQAGNVLTPTVEWKHNQQLVSGEQCTTTGSSSSMGVAYGRNSLLLPRTYRGALFFGDFARGCVWYQPNGGSPTFLAGLPGHTMRSITSGPLDQLYFVDYQQGSVRRFDLR